MENSASTRPPAVKETKPDQTVECTSLVPLSPLTPYSHLLEEGNESDPEANTTSFSLSEIYSKVRNKKEVKTQNLLPSSEPFAKEKSLKLGMRLQHETELKAFPVK